MLENGFMFCGNHPLLLTRIHVSDPGPTGSLVLQELSVALLEE